MIDRLLATLPWLPASLGALVLLLGLPLWGEVGRRRAVLLFLLGTTGMVVLATRNAGETVSAQVVTMFPLGALQAVAGGPAAGGQAVGPVTPVVLGLVTAAGWQWRIVVASFLFVAAMWSFATVRLPVRAPSPVGHCLLVGTVFVALRLVLEHNAAPTGLAWAVDITLGVPILVAFLGWFVGERLQGWLSFASALLLVALLQRALVAGVGWVATVQAWGTHLDVHGVAAIDTLWGERRFGPGPNERWLWLVALPQAVWAALTVLLGLLIGGVLLLSIRRGR